MDLNKQQWTGLATLVAIGALALGFWDAVWLWPLKILVVFFHELGHAIAALVTGGTVVGIELSPMQGGLTKTQGGIAFFVLSAGYLGSLAFGVLWLFLGRTEKLARYGAWVLAIFLLFATLWWVRPLVSFGFGYAVVASIAALALARFAPPVVKQWFLRIIGVFSVMYAVWDIRDDVLSRQIASSDASQLAELTFIPGPVWGILWIGIGLGVLYALRKWIL